MAETELQSPVRLPLPYPDDIPQQEEKHDLEGPQLPDAGAWRRLFARTFDMWWQIPAVIFVTTVSLGLAVPSFLEWAQTERGNQLMVLVSVPLAFILDALLLARFGRSPGKALLGLRLVTKGGARLGYGAAIRRNLLLWVAGLGLTIPLISLAAMSFQGWRVANGEGTIYDAGRYRVEARPLGWGRWLGFVCAMVAMGLVLVGLAHIGNQADVPESAPVSAAFTWTNPETGEAVTVPPGWAHTMSTTDDGLPLHLFVLDTGRAAVQFSVQATGVATMADMTRDTNAMVESVEMGAGREELFLGSPSWAAEGFADDDTVTRVEVRVMHHEARYWRVLAAQHYPYEDSSPQVNALRDLLWSSVKAAPMQ